MNKQTPRAVLGTANRETTDYSIGASIKIDYERDLAMTEPDQPGGRIVYDSYAYDSQEEADAALEAFFERIIEGRYEENT
jgi:hypothetical protein